MSDLIYAFTRADAIANEEQFVVDTKISKEAGITIPVYITRAVWKQYVEMPLDYTLGDQDERGRLWDVLWMLRCAIAQSKGKESAQHLDYELYVKNSKRPKLVVLRATIGPVDIADPSPSMTIMMPDED